jgi:chromosomal replication initiator protein
VSDVELHPAWRSIRAQLRAAVSDTAWDLWLEPLQARSIDDRTVVVEATEESISWVQGRFGRLLHDAAASVLGQGAQVEIVLPGQEPAPGGGSAVSAPQATAGDLFNPRYTFDQFVIGDGNRFAHGAALAVAEMPGLAYNPLFICGPPGLGKTHLLHSIANYIVSYGNGTTVRYTTAEAFTDHYVHAARSRDMNGFKEAYRGVDVLLVDDVQFLQSRVKTEQEFFHTFNSLHAAGAQIVLTSDRLPRDMDALEDRLRERFEAGLVTDIQPPDYATRLTILRKRALQDGLRGLHPGVLEVVAERVTNNVRTLEGALIRIVAFASLTGSEPTPELATQALDGLYPETRTHRRTVRDIQERTAALFGVSVDSLVSTSRATVVTWPRQIAMYLSRELTDETLPAIGREFGNRNHTTVMHACKRTQQRIASDAEAFDAVRRLTEELGGASDDRPA